MEGIDWKVKFGTLGETQVSARNWYGAVKGAAVKLGLQGKYPMSFLSGIANVTKMQPKMSGRKKMFNFRG